MGSSGEEPNKGIDATAGGLVWVRRRNGSWWPGQILGPDELPEGCVPTPRCGTPVKLLGREDASVDWYNMEKSKRVKAFHCKEYDDCIKKVKESASHLSKKGAKYARRDDAILHALELERTRLGIDQPQLSSLQVPQNDESGSLSHLSEEIEELDSSGGDLDSVSNSGEETKQNDSEDDGFEGVKRMRGLEDLGMGVASSIRKKRSDAANVHELLRRKNRHRPLTKVMASTTIVSMPAESNGPNNNDSVVESNGVSSENGTLLDESTELKELVEVPLVAEERGSTGLSSVVSGRFEASPSANDEHDGSAPTSETPEWRFKGKRNSRPRKVENEAETEVVDREHFFSAFNRNSESKNHGPSNWSWNIPEPHVSHRLLPYRQSRFTVNPKYDDSDLSLRSKNPVSGLFEVKVKVEVKTGNRPHHVPYISLMSKFTGRPIIGHPLTIDISDDGPKQQPRRRTPAPSRARSSQRSRKTTTLSKKTRRLSSLTTRRESRAETKPVVEKLKGPSIACVPLKVVFSRINAALSGSVRRSAATSVV